MLLAQRRGATQGWNRFLVPGLAGTAAFILIYLTRDLDARPLGRYLFSIVFLLALARLFVGNIGLSRHLFLEERGQKSLALLFLTGLKPSDVVLGKSVGVLATMLFPVFSLLPFFLLSLFMGGISDGVLWAALLSLFALHLLVLGVHLLTSVTCTDQTTADSLADWILAFLALGPWAFHMILRLFGATLPDTIFLLSPGYAPWSLYHSNPFASMFDIHLSNGISMLYALACFVLAAWLLKRAWKQESEGETLSPQSKLWRFAHSVLALPRSQLDVNPYAWLAGRNTRPITSAWLFLLGVVLLWVIAILLAPNKALTPAWFWVTCLALPAIIAFTLGFQHAAQIAFDRTHGTLELLLATPLSPAEIIAGNQIASNHFARPLRIALLLLYAAFFTLGLCSRPYSAAALLSYCLIWALILAVTPWWRGEHYHVTFWVALNLGSPGRVLFQNHLVSIFFAFYFLALSTLLRPFTQRPTGSTPEIVFVLLALLFIPFLAKSFRAKQNAFRENALRDLRLIAAHPIPASSDPRVANWRNFSQPLFPEEPNLLRV